MAVPLLPLPCFKLLASFGGHDFGHAVVDGRNGSHVRLVFGDVELVGKVALFEFAESKGFGKRREGHLEETEGIDETNDLVAFHLQEFTPVADLFHLLVVGIVLVHHEIPIVHVEGWRFFVLLVLILVSFLIGPQGLEASGSTSFGRRTSLTLTFTFAFLFLLLDFLRGESSLNVAAMTLSVDVLVAGRTIHVPAAVTLNVF